MDLKEKLTLNENEVVGMIDVLGSFEEYVNQNFSTDEEDHYALVAWAMNQADTRAHYEMLYGDPVLDFNKVVCHMVLVGFFMGHNFAIRERSTI